MDLEQRKLSSARELATLTAYQVHALQVLKSLEMMALLRRGSSLKYASEHTSIQIAKDNLKKCEEEMAYHYAVLGMIHPLHNGEHGLYWKVMVAAMRGSEDLDYDRIEVFADYVSRTFDITHHSYPARQGDDHLIVTYQVTVDVAKETTPDTLIKMINNYIEVNTR